MRLNAQHYEVPAAFYRLCLGKHLKYSACLWPNPAPDASTRRKNACWRSAARAPACADGQDVLELGCGWGSLTLWIAAAIPGEPHHRRVELPFAAAATSASRRAHVGSPTSRSSPATSSHSGAGSGASIAWSRSNASNTCATTRSCLRRIATWLKPDGCLFVHVFTHLSYAYPVRDRRRRQLVGRHFFTGGIDALGWPACCASRTTCGSIAHWRVNGRHYGQHRARLAGRISGAIVARPRRIARGIRQSARARAACSSSAGACSSWPARSCGTTMMGRNGW
jgi:cyclopropane-fatty-acyl-phospholipid synthase